MYTSIMHIKSTKYKKFEGNVWELEDNKKKLDLVEVRYCQEIYISIKQIFLNLQMINFESQSTNDK